MLTLYHIFPPLGKSKYEKLLRKIVPEHHDNRRAELYVNVIQAGEKRPKAKTELIYPKPDHIRENEAASYLGMSLQPRGIMIAKHPEGSEKIMNDQADRERKRLRNDHAPSKRAENELAKNDQEAEIDNERNAPHKSEAHQFRELRVDFKARYRKTSPLRLEDVSPIRV